MTTTSKILLGTAVWAVSGLALAGCVTVQPRSSPPLAPPARSESPAPVVGPRIAQGPGRAVLAPAPPARTVDPPAPRPPRRTWSPRPRAAAEPTAPRPVPAAPPPRARKPEPRQQQPRARGTRHRIPDVCALGERYGSWRPDSAAARLCREALRDARRRLP
ncbi:hypothetical protein [Streptomyces sp. NPDC020965]|uniref:hypothetical protein n=1 Tax=Streptomyces sp. NPDC020965 TaxID=3365105 RepID=UPI003791DA88